jgi:very-short-patch-repair endonuclease
MNLHWRRIVLWQHIRNRRIGDAKFRRQHAVEGFIIDFVCIEQRLIIEVDGEIHDQPDQQVYDRQRQSLLESCGFCVLRFTNAEVLRAIEAVIIEIGEAIVRSHSRKNLTPDPSS